jgi:hypothetical protein
VILEDVEGSAEISRVKKINIVVFISECEIEGLNRIPSDAVT